MISSRYVAGVLTLTALAATGCGGDSGAYGSSGAQPVSGSGAMGLTRWPASEREAAPRLEGPLLGGGRLALAEFRGKVVVVNTWGSWCAPCRDEAPDLQRVYSETRDRGVRFLGINTRDNPAAARAFVREFGITYPSLVDRDGRLMLAFRGLLPVQAVPSTLVIDRDRRVTARVVGKVSYATLRGLVGDVLAERTQPTRSQGSGAARDRAAAAGEGAVRPARA